MKNISFFTLGCKVNQYETQLIKEQFLKYGCRESSLEDSEIVLINTCTVTAKSDSKSLRLIRRAVKQSLPNAEIIVTGCLAEKDSDKIKKIQGVRYIFKNKAKKQIAAIVLKDKEVKLEESDLKINNFSDKTRAFVKIQDGCNNSCSYCKVTLVRGPSTSRLAESVLKEIKYLINAGYKEIVLTGICLGAYGLDLKGKNNLKNLLEKIVSIKGSFRLRLSSIELNDLNKSLIDFILANDKICRHFHIPLQSGDDRILKLMNRHYNCRKVEEKIEYIRNADPYFSFSTDIMVGFPSETEDSIENTCSLLKKIKPVRTHVFNFSPREGTKAYEIENTVTEEDKKRWHKKIVSISDKVSYEYKRMFINKIMFILPEKKSGFVCGKNQYYFDVKVNKKNGFAMKNSGFLKIKIQKIDKKKVYGNMIT